MDEAQIQCGAAYGSIINNLQSKNSFLCTKYYLHNHVFMYKISYSENERHSGVAAAVWLPMMHLTEVAQTLWALQTRFTLYLTHLWMT